MTTNARRVSLFTGPHALSVPRTLVWRTLISPSRAARRNQAAGTASNAFPYIRPDCPLLNTSPCRSLSSLFLLLLYTISRCYDSSIINTTCAVVAAIKLSSGGGTWCSFPCTRPFLSCSTARPSAPRQLWCSRHYRGTRYSRLFGVEFSTRASSNPRIRQHRRYFVPAP